jgi:EAL domain-containing protein (putative c-di-GMP-specific phosphodiesterase class I)
VSKWQKAFPQEEPLTLSVNLSGRQFRKINLIEEVREIISKTGIAPDTLRLEITESVLMDNAAQTAEMLRQLKSTGVKLSIDDFGTGYSSLSYLHRFPFDILKIDRSFVGRMSTDRESRGIVKTIATLAFELNKQVIAEGVESNEHRLTLTELGCGYGQGYYFAKPLAADQAEQLLQTDLPLPQGKAAPTSPLPALSETGLVETVRQSYAM